jgi:hypothetical protein
MKRLKDRGRKLKLRLNERGKRHLLRIRDLKPKLRQRGRRL